MAAGPKTKLFIACLVMANALLLINVRRLTLYLPGAPAGVGRRDYDQATGIAPVPHETSFGDSADKSWGQDGKRVRPLSSVETNVTEGEVTEGGGDGGEMAGTGSAGSSGKDGGKSEAGSPGHGSGGGGTREGGPGGGEQDVPGSLSADAKECNAMLEALKIIPGVDWGLAEKKSRQRWALLQCDRLVEREGNGGATRAPPQDCTARPSLPTDPLIAVCAGSTTRGVDDPDETSLALFRFLLLSLGRTADCGFNYLAVIGYDVGDTFFDSDAGRERVERWFEREVQKPGALRGLNFELELVRVPNEIRKPGPVFTATTKAAYESGADYIYRVNDDSEMIDPWPRKFVNTLEAMGPPYGVVGPESLNKNILVHDFTHRLHMDIFDRQYYPASLTDWYVDDWISRVYGNARTVRAKNCEVEHHTGAHGQRYTADRSKASSLKGLIQDGSARIAAWATANGHDDAARQILSDNLDGRSATREAAQNIS